jgi:hypothetical protein
MSGQRHQLFTDALTRFAASTADERWASIAQRLTAPLRVVVSGRRGVGRSTVSRALARAGIDVVRSQDAADLEIYVIAEVVKPEDSAAVASARHPVVAVCNKADLASGPNDVAGVAVEPMMGLLAAAAALDDRLADSLWPALRALAAEPADLSSADSFVAGDHSVPAKIRQRLLDTLDLFGTASAVAAIRQGMPEAGVRALLRRLSRIDVVAASIATAGAEVRYRRILDVVADLETLAVTDRRAADFLSRDHTAIARMAAAVDVVEAAGLHVDGCDTAEAQLRRAVRWQHYARGPVTDVHRACGADIARGSLRLWSKAGGSP